MHHIIRLRLKHFVDPSEPQHHPARSENHSSEQRETAQSQFQRTGGARLAGDRTVRPPASRECARSVQCAAWISGSDRLPARPDLQASAATNGASFLCFIASPSHSASLALAWSMTEGGEVSRHKCFRISSHRCYYHMHAPGFSPKNVTWTVTECRTRMFLVAICHRHMHYLPAGTAKASPAAFLARRGAAGCSP